MWQNILKVNKLQTGDILEVNSKTPVFKYICSHYAVVLIKEGELYITDCIDSGPRLITLDEFEKERVISNVFRNEITKKLTDKAIEDKYKELKIYGYNFMQMNCEDYVKRICGCYIGIDDRVVTIIIISFIVIIVLGSVIAVIRRRK